MKKLSSVALLALISMLTMTHCNKNNCVEKDNPNCACTKQYDPVCGCNGKTYGNACMADCAGIENYTEGECQ